MAPLLPGFRCQVLTYTGNGSSPRTIATDFPLDVGLNAAFAQGTTSANAYHRNSAYPANSSSVAGDTTIHTDAILAFVAGGVSVGAALNSNGLTYALLVWQDTTADHVHLAAGSYSGNGIARTIANIGFGADPPDAVFVFGRSGVYRSNLFLGNSAVQMSHEAGGVVVTNLITGFVVDGFTLGTDTNVNGSGMTYYWTALRTAHLQAGYSNFRVLGTAAAEDNTGSLGFTPTWAWAAKLQAGATLGGFFRGPAHTGTQSVEWNGSGGAVSGGIDALNADTVSLGASLAPNGVYAYGFAVRSFTYPADWILLNDASENAKVRRENSEISIHDVLNDAPNTASLTVQGQPGGPGPQGGSRLDIYDPATARKLFTGSFQTIDQFYDERPTQLGWNVTAIDATWRLNKYRPFGEYTDVSATTVVLDLITKYAPGFTGDYVQTNLAAISLTLDGTLTFSEALTAICQAIGAGHWYPDYDDDVHLFRTPPATIAITYPPAPATAITFSESATALPGGTTPGFYLVIPVFRYADGATSYYGPLSNVVLMSGTKKFQLDNIPIGTSDPDHGAVVARLIFRQGWAFVFDPPQVEEIFSIEDNTTTSVTYGFVDAPPVMLPEFLTAGPPFPAPVTLPTGPAAPTVAWSASNNLGGEGVMAGTTFEFALTNVYADGVESLPSAWSNLLTQAFTGTTKKVDFSSVATGSSDPTHGAVIYRKIYARLSLPASHIVGWLIVPNNSSTTFNDDWRYANTISVGFFGELPANPRVDGPNLESGDAPDAITDSTTTLLADPPITLSEDYSQIRTRVYGRGAGSLVSVDAPLSAVSLRVADISLFEPLGGHVIVGTTVLDYYGITGSYLSLVEPLAEAILFGTVVNLWVVRNDLAAQQELGAVELDEDGNRTDGVHEFTVVDTNLRSVDALNARCDAELALFSRPIKTVRYATRDPKTKSGQSVAITLTTPPIAGTFVIQDVTIDQIHFNATLVARYTVTASSVRFTLDDLLQRVILSGTTGPGTGSSASSSGGSGSGGGGTGTVVNSGTLDDNHLILGDSGTRIEALSDTGTATKVLHGAVSGVPTFSAVDLAADVTGLLPAAKVDFTGVTLGLSRAQVLSEALLR